MGTGHLDSGYKVGNHVLGTKDIGGGNDAPVPFVPADVGGFSRTQNWEELFIPDLVVGVVNLNPGVLQNLLLIFWQSLCYRFGDPATGEFFLDGTGVVGVELCFTLPLEAAGDRPSCQGVSL